MTLATYAPPAGRYAFAGLGLQGPAPALYNVPGQFSAHPHLAWFLLGAAAMYALPPFLGGVWTGARDELRDRAEARRPVSRAEAARRRRLAMRSRR